jgi:hypothetical protein
MENFNAEQAKHIVDSLHTDELHNILTDIKKEAEKGKSVCDFYRYIEKGTRQVLTEKGFKVIEHPSIAIQKDGLYHSVYWA